MSIIKKPNAKGVTDGAVKAIAMVVGAKIGDGVASVMPESVAPYKGYILATLGILGGACINTATTGGQIAQSAMIGMGVKQLYNEVTNATKDAVAARTGTETTDRFINAVMGHGETAALGNPYEYAYQPQYSLNAPWEPTPEQTFAPFQAT